MITRDNRQWHDVTHPTLIVRPEVAKANIARMAEKARRSGARFRPHFKTHQSVAVGAWFKEVGVSAITVSSVAMAWHFAEAGWREITIAFPLNVRELASIDALAERVRLHLLVENPATLAALAAGLKRPASIWLEIDTGYRRSGVAWDDSATLLALAQATERQPHLSFAGLLTHAGHSYQERSPEGILRIFEETRARLRAAQRTLAQAGIKAQLSLGDTPCCSLAEDFDGIDEIRPGNFVFYDLHQRMIGACSDAQLALAVACPVVAVYPERGELVLYGGATHLSKDVAEVDGVKRHGAIALLSEDGWSLSEVYVATVSQEHGLVNAPAALLDRVHVGDLLLVIPAHACLAVNLLRTYRSLNGEWLN
jgi:D-serine deaminase-like pyridoxal phosphate-dependent protein